MDFLGVFLGVFLIVAVICAFKESKVTGLYKTFGVYGRWSAYLAFDFLFAGLAMAILGIVDKVQGQGDVKMMLITVVVGLLISVLGLFLYKRAYNRCPDFLKKKCIISMIITAMGISLKLALFFIAAVWAITGPKVVVDENGTELYVVSGDVYDGGGNKVGVMSGNNQYTKI